MAQDSLFLKNCCFCSCPRLLVQVAIANIPLKMLTIYFCSKPISIIVLATGPIYQGVPVCFSHFEIEVA